MRAYIIRRLFLMIPTFILVTVTVFCVVRFIPGSVIDQMMAGMGGGAGEEKVTRAELESALGLDIPIHVQYGRWLAGIFRGDLGKSIWTNAPVTQEIIHRLPVSIELGIIALIIGLIIAIPIGIYSGIRQDTVGDYGGRTVAILFISLPTFWVGTMVMVYPSIWLGWSPPVQYIPFADNPTRNLAQFVIPATIMGMQMSGTTMRMTRTMMLEVLRQDYIRTAWSKGLRERVVVIRHALRNALIPVVTIVGMMLPILIAGSVIMEQIFCLPGVGRLLVEALNKRNYPIISGVNLFVASAILLINLAVDLSYAYINPRIRYR
jgi:peptide/nickel transport system permease protein